MKTLTYTFNSFKHKELLKKDFGNVFIFQKLKVDLEKIKAINKFNQGKVNRVGKESYDLFIPNIKIQHGIPSDSFCNWTMYKISEFLEENKLDIKLSFIHLDIQDFNKLNSSLFTRDKNGDKYKGL
ncbi:MAG: hypothetical protein ABI721_01575 [Candidatus Dojkabacteria bacterium]